MADSMTVGLGSEIDSARAHWDAVYSSTAPEARAWYENDPVMSLRLIRSTGLGRSARVLDVGGGTSLLLDRLLDVGYTRLGLLDVSPLAVAEARQRLGARAWDIECFSADVRRFTSPHAWDVWHDRGLFHLLTDRVSRREYCAVLRRSLSPGGHVIIAAFGPQGPECCGRLPAQRYDSAALRAELGPHFSVVESLMAAHHTPGGATQQFVYCRMAHGGSVITALDGVLMERA